MQNASTCEYCRRRGQHLISCPEGDTVALQIWRAGHQAALNGQRNTCANDETYSLGFTSGEMERERLNASERRPSTPPEELFPEHAPDDRPSRAPVSVSEFSLIIDEIRNPPLSTPGNEESVIPPILRYDPKAVYDREIAARLADHF